MYVCMYGRTDTIIKTNGLPRQSSMVGQKKIVKLAKPAIFVRKSYFSLLHCQGQSSNVQKPYFPAAAAMLPIVFFGDFF